MRVKRTKIDHNGHAITIVQINNHFSWYFYKSNEKHSSEPGFYLESFEEALTAAKSKMIMANIKFLELEFNSRLHLLN